MLLVWGPEGRGLTPLPGSDFVVAGVSVRAQELWILGVTARRRRSRSPWFYERTLAGKALRACAEQPVAARLVGISPSRRRRCCRSRSPACSAAIAGVLASPDLLQRLGLRARARAQGIRRRDARRARLDPRRGRSAGWCSACWSRSSPATSTPGSATRSRSCVLIVVLVARPGRDLRPARGGEGLMRWHRAIPVRSAARSRVESCRLRAPRGAAGRLPARRAGPGRQRRRVRADLRASPRSACRC